MGEFGVYDFRIEPSKNCEFTTAKDPVDIYMRKSLYYYSRLLIYILIE